jgi:hypothetical protein
MSVVTDPELIKKLKKKQQKGTDTPVGVVTNPELIKTLQQKQTKLIEDMPVEPVEDTKPSAVEEGSVIGDFGRTAASIATAIAAEPLAGLYGLASYAATGGDFRRAVKDIEQAKQTLTYMPETRGSQESLQAIGEFMAPLAEGIETVSDNFADVTFEYTGSPNLAGVAAAVPLVALELAGIKGVRAAGGGVVKLKDADIRKAQKASLLDPELKYDGSVAEVKLDPKGRLVEDKVGKKLVENGIRENDVAVITKSSKPTKTQMKEMIKVFEAGRGNDVVAMSSRTTKPIGVSITNRLQSLKTTRAGLGRRLQGIVDSDLGNTKVDISSSMDEINKTLNAEGIKPRVNAQGKIILPKDWYKGTRFELKSLAGVRRTIEDSYKLMSMTSTYGVTDLKSAHKLKKNLDEMIDASKLTEDGVPANTIRQVANMRARVNAELSKVPEYASVNKELANVIQAMAPFEKYLKPGESWSDAKVVEVVGASMKNLASDSASASSLVQDLAAMEKYMRQAGIAFGDDPKALIRFRQTLSENFNVVTPSADGTVGRTVGSAAVSLALGNKFGAGHDAARLIGAGMKKREAKKIANQNKKAFNLMKMAVNE